MTVQNKIYECMATGKAVIAGRSPAIEQNFIDSQQILSVNRNHYGIAEGIKYLFEKGKSKGGQ